MTHLPAAARHIAWLLGLGLLAATAPLHADTGPVADGIPAGDPQVATRLADYLAGRHATFLDWLPDGSLLVSTRFGEQAQVHRVAAPLGMREQLTWSSGPALEVAAPHAGDTNGFALVRDTGDGQPQLYWYQFKTHATQVLSSGAAVHGSPVWSKDGQHVAFFGTERGPQVYDIYAADVGTGTQPRLLIGGNGRPWQPLDWSADGKLLLWQPTDGVLYTADSTTGAVTALDPTGKLTGVRSARFAPDGRGVYVIADVGEFAQLRLFDPVTRQVQDITSASWDVEDFDVGADGRYLAYVVNENGRSRLTVLDARQKLELQPAGLPDGVISHPRFDPTGRLLAFSAESPLAPRDVFVFEPEHNQLTRWTRSELGAVDPQSFVDAQAVRFPTWDKDKAGRRQIPALVYKPRAPGQHPVLIDIHDGPDAQARPGFDAFVQFAVNELGYVVVAPNIRGSTGYGRSFSQLDDGAQRDDALRDLGSLLVWIGQQPGMDRGHVVVMGQSFGGFMALATLAAYGDRLRGGIDIAGIASIPAYLADAPPGQQPLLRAELGDERDPRTRAAQDRLSPLNNLVQIRRPLLVAQGLDDQRTRVEQSGQIVASLRSRGVEAWHLRLPGEGHRIEAQSNRDAWADAAAQFLKKMAQ